MTHTLPPAARLAWWGTSWLRGLCSPDDLLDAVQGDSERHLVSGLVGGEQPLGIVPALAVLRDSGATSLGAAFPVEGDPVGLGGPSEFNRGALEAGEAVLAVDAELGLVPSETDDGWFWQAGPALRRPLVDVGEADRALRSALIESSSALAALDVARWRPEVADELLNLRHGPEMPTPEGIPPRCIELAGRSWQAMAICDLALADDGAAITAAEASARRDALVPLDRAGRRGLTAACSPEVWPEPHSR